MQKYFIYTTAAIIKLGKKQEEHPKPMNIHTLLVGLWLYS